MLVDLKKRMMSMLISIRVSINSPNREVNCDDNDGCDDIP